MVPCLGGGNLNTPGKMTELYRKILPCRKQAARKMLWEKYLSDKGFIPADGRRSFYNPIPNFKVEGGSRYNCLHMLLFQVKSYGILNENISTKFSA